jgi:hypothetical protein
MTQHTEHSTYREKLIEHLFVGELLKHSWLSRTYSLEVARPEVDRAGYDVVLEEHGITRHVQLKATFKGSTVRRQKVHTFLAKKPSGCIVVIEFNESLGLGPYLFFGGLPGSPLPALESFKVARHSKGNAQGEKTLRPNIREVPHSAFVKAVDLKELYTLMFGTAWAQQTVQGQAPASRVPPLT